MSALDDRLLPVYKYEVPEFVGTGGTLRTASTRVEAVVLPRRYEVTEGTLTVELEPSLAVTTLNAIEALRQFACECTETTASRLIANVAGLRALRALGDPDDPRIAELTEQANLAIQRLIAQQKVDGGWGWYSSLRSESVKPRAAALEAQYALCSGIERYESADPICRMTPLFLGRMCRSAASVPCT